MRGVVPYFNGIKRISITPVYHQFLSNIQMLRSIRMKLANQYRPAAKDFIVRRKLCRCFRLDFLCFFAIVGFHQISTRWTSPFDRPCSYDGPLVKVIISCDKFLDYGTKPLSIFIMLANFFINIFHSLVIYTEINFKFLPNAFK